MSETTASSPLQQQILQEFDPYSPNPLARPETDWVSQATPKNYLPKKNALKRYEGVDLPERKTCNLLKAMGDGLSWLMSSAYHFLASQHKAPGWVAVAFDLVDFSDTPTTKKTSMARLTNREYEKQEDRAMDNYLAELNNLEQYIQMQPWYQELKEVFELASQKKARKNYDDIM